MTQKSLFFNIADTLTDEKHFIYQIIIVYQSFRLTLQRVKITARCILLPETSLHSKSGETLF